ncbi:MAG: acylphosphatase [Actinobacteria bacterium]|nr:acylphosphatase [Actinomycetota bacterium]
MKARARVTLSGRVQGVYYRSYARDEARRLGLKGWVRNNPDGRVELVCEGEEDAVLAMIDWCWKGSPSSRVSDVEVAWEEYRGEFDDFRVTYGF